MVSEKRDEWAASFVEAGSGSITSRTFTPRSIRCRLACATEDSAAVEMNQPMSAIQIPSKTRPWNAQKAPPAIIR